MREGRNDLVKLWIGFIATAGTYVSKGSGSLNTKHCVSLVSVKRFNVVLCEIASSCCCCFRPLGIFR